MSTDALAFCRDPIFIIGSPRSGTSALARSLGEHNELWFSCEASIFYHLFGADRLDDIYAREIDGQKWLHAEGVSREEFLWATGLGINALYTGRSGGNRWIEKMPANTFMADVLADMFPGASFVHILRDGRRAVNSMVNFRPPRKWGATFRTACITWRQHVVAAMDFAAARPDRCLTVQNEGLVHDPEEGVSRIFQFLGVSYDRRPVEFFRSRQINSSFQRGSVGPLPAEFLSYPWKQWTLEQRQTFLEEAGAMMVRCGLLTADQLHELETDARDPIKCIPVRPEEDGSTER